MLAAMPRSNTAPAVSREEWELRVKLAATYRILQHLGWVEAIYGHVTMRVTGPERHFLINPWGLRYDEVTASSLIKIDLDGNIIGESAYPVLKAGFIIHSAVHQARADAHCVMHTHTTAGMAVAAQAQGLLPVSMPATGFHERVAYHEYEGPSLKLDERQRLAASLGGKKAMILRNHGLLTLGESIEEAFILMFRLQRACEVQVAAQGAGIALHVPGREVLEESAKLTDEFLASNDGHPVGGLEFQSYMRLMDRIDPSFRN